MSNGASYYVEMILLAIQLCKTAANIIHCTLSRLYKQGNIISLFHLCVRTIDSVPKDKLFRHSKSYSVDVRIVSLYLSA